MSKKKVIFGNSCGWIGMILIQSSTLPVTWAIFKGENAHIPPMSMVLLVWAGIVLYLIRAVIQRDMVHMVSNSIGFITQSVLMAMIVFK